MEYKKKDHRCWRKKGEAKCIDLYTELQNKDNTKKRYVHIYEDDFTFTEENPLEKEKKEILKKEWYVRNWSVINMKRLTEKCLYILKELFNSNQ